MSSLKDDIAADLEEASALHRQRREFEARLRDRDASIGQLKAQLGFVTAIDQTRLSPPKWLAPTKSRKRHVGTACALLTDTHFGEQVAPIEVDHLNAYDLTIGIKRLQKFAQGAVEVARDYISGVEYDGMVLFIGGDIFSGVIHDELVETNQGTLYQNVIDVLDPLRATIDLLADAFGRLHCVAVVGNHGRRTRKPRAKGRAQDNIEWLMYRVLERDTRADSRITWQVSDSADALVGIYDTRFLLTHGDQFRGGSGISGALAPLMLGSHRKTRRAMSAGRPYDELVMGHWHQYLRLPGVIVGGTLKGYDEFAYVSNFAYAEPSQAFWVTTPERGVTFSEPIYVQDRKAEGW